MSEDKTRVFLRDCMEGMKEYPDKYFDLAIVDPPYGIGMDGGNIGGDNQTKATQYIKKSWDAYPPLTKYWDELFRVSGNQVIWGGNYFTDRLKPVKGWIVWKKMDVKNNFSPFELAWTSYSKASMFDFLWAGMWQENMKDKEDRIHPTQKPVALYKWLLKNYAKPGDKILDTHLGSGSSRIAAYDMGFDFTGYEIDPDYFAAQEKRFNQFKSQTKLFV